MKGCDAFSVRHINHFLQFFWYDLCHSLLLPHMAAFFIFAIVVESSSMIIVDMQAFSVVPETNMSTAKSLSIAFELPPQFILQSCSFTGPVSLFTSHCLQLLIRVPLLKIFSLSVPIKTPCPDLLLYALRLPFLCQPMSSLAFKSITPSLLAALLFKLHKFYCNSVASRQDFLATFSIVTPISLSLFFNVCTLTGGTSKLAINFCIPVIDNPECIIAPAAFVFT